MIRITADYDTKNKFNIINNLIKCILLIDKIEKLELKKSNSKGYHLILWTKQKYTNNQIYKLRQLIGDDRKRIKMDKIRPFGKQTLFHKKININKYNHGK